MRAGRLSLIALIIALPSLSRADSQDEIKRLLDTERQYDEWCREMLGGDLHTVEACDLRNAYERQLNAKGWCFGRRGETTSEMMWHRCRHDSLRR